MSTKPVCGCKIVHGNGQSPRISYCPFHETGPALWRALNTISPMLDAIVMNKTVRPDIRELVRLLARLVAKTGTDQEALMGIRPVVMADMLSETV